MGFAVPRCLRVERWSLTPPFHPYPNSCEPGRYILCGTFRRDASRRHLPRVSPTESELRGIAPCGVRTFLPRLAPEAILRLSKTKGIIRHWRGGASRGNIQIPTSKLQRRSNNKTPICARKLVFEVWNFSGPWMLVLGAFSPPQPNPYPASNTKCGRN